MYCTVYTNILTHSYIKLSFCSNSSCRCNSNQSKPLRYKHQSRMDIWWYTCCQ